ncbi:hsp70 family protein [Myxococcus stipitatus]|uniref:Hsp70 family protein n=1 Tax=Myxococcus stipitatus TaxID=83455 RepID=UPI001F329623|nr:Hsp70 family protein [Myxococcus stipitatus]MCE9667843.1 hsp70 family protein [Myxococcus stipitatus]
MRIVGIDLGTTHCAVASVDPTRGASAPVEDFSIPQLVRQGEVAPRALLPSTVYVPAGHELSADSLRLPWGDDGGPYVVGELARWQGARVPGRLVASAKSWLCHPGVDRSAPILPWGAPADVHKLSPVDASALLLTHMARAWDFAHPDAPLAKQEVVITVPASFDESARALTVSAARKAGLEKFTLLEEPQAAFYDYTARHRSDLARTLADVRLVLVVDVGGGTTDFTLVHAGVSPEGPMLRRLAVGDHLMLGGDNMDAALARRLEEKLFPDGRRLSATQWTQAIQAARAAKESLLGKAPPEKHGVSLVGEGSRLLGGTLSSELSRDEAQALVLDGFFPRTAPTDRPRRAARMALQELGLPYVQDAAVTRHLAAFLAQHAAAGFAALGETSPSEGALPRPDAILLNGGVFNSPWISDRLVEAVSAWWPQAPRIPLLRHESLELAVARGAAYYGLVRRGHGLRIGGGAARAYYVGLQRPADSAEQPALCLIPRGFEEGQKVDLGERPFTLTLGRPVQFQLYSTTSDRIDKPGDLVPLAEDLKPLPPIHTLLKGATGKVADVPVHLQAALTEIGTLELYCVSDVADERWRLEFELRGTGGSHELTVTESMPARFAEAKENIERVYGNKPLPLGPKDVKQLSRTLEKALGPRDTWRVPVLREMWSTLFAGASKRRRSEDHERVFYSLAGFTLRPGFGYPLDGWRAEQTFGLFEALAQHHTDKAVWTEFWVMWRRVSGGLTEAQQQKLYAYLQPHLARRVPPDAPAPGKLKGIQPEGLEEMVRTAASLEHLSPGDKAEVGRWIAARLEAEAKSGGPWAWALGRLGARVPLYGSGHKVVDVETAEAWLSLLLKLDLRKIDGAPFAAAQLARLTGDRTRDIDPALRERTAEALVAAKASETWVRMVREVVALEAADEARALGDTLPAGLRLS